MKTTTRYIVLSVLLFGLIPLVGMLAGCTGPAGPAGPAGLAGLAGAAGPSGPTATAALNATASPSPTPKVVVSAGTAQTADPGAGVTLKSTVKVNDGSNIKSYKWTQTAGLPLIVSNSDTDTLSVTLAKASDYKAALIKNLTVLDRYEVMGINPEALALAKTETFKLVVTTDSGVYNGTVSLTAKLPYDTTTSLADVPIGIPVVLNGKNESSYSWTLTVPNGSKATLNDPGSRNPVFTPDITGKYTITEATGKGSLDVYGGTWEGAITGQNAKGQPVAAACTTCHNGTIAPNQFAAWSQSGHAVILTKNINDPAGHWSLSCAGCHSVGDSAVSSVHNGGFDEAIAAEGWKAPAHGDPTNWTTMLAQDPKSAQLANIQCENCHGPNQSPAHIDNSLTSARISLSADVCGSCHGEPPHHGLYQQWQESAHGSFDLAISESGSASCARCHTAQGFMTWTDQGGQNLSKQIQGAKGNATASEMAAIVTGDTAQPQTCQVCHDPHAQGSGTANATVRISGDTPLLPSGFTATNVGKGAICMVCHNTRNGLHNDANPPTSNSAPHSPSQTDILMGQNAFFVTTERSPHADIQDTCVTCHMEDSPAPADLTTGTGANHTFEADIKMCGKCHTNSLNGKALQDGVKVKLEGLANAITQYLSSKLPAGFTVVEQTPHTYNNKSYDLASDPLVINKDDITSIQLVEVHGQLGFILELKNAIGVNYKPANEQPHSVSAKSVQFQLGNLTTDGKTQVIPVSDNLIKAEWNYDLISGDGSLGIHNPDFVNKVIDASVSALK